MPEPDLGGILAKSRGGEIVGERQGRTEKVWVVVQALEIADGVVAHIMDVCHPVSPDLIRDSQRIGFGIGVVEVGADRRLVPGVRIAPKRNIWQRLSTNLIAKRTCPG